MQDRPGLAVDHDAGEGTLGQEGLIAGLAVELAQEGAGGLPQLGDAILGGGGTVAVLGLVPREGSLENEAEGERLLAAAVEFVPGGGEGLEGLLGGEIGVEEQ